MCLFVYRFTYVCLRYKCIQLSIYFDVFADLLEFLLYINIFKHILFSYLFICLFVF